MVSDRTAEKRVLGHSPIQPGAGRGAHRRLVWPDPGAEVRIRAHRVNGHGPSGAKVLESPGIVRAHGHVFGGHARPALVPNTAHEVRERGLSGTLSDKGRSHFTTKTELEGIPDVRGELVADRLALNECLVARGAGTALLKWENLL